MEGGIVTKALATRTDQALAADHDPTERWDATLHSIEPELLAGDPILCPSDGRPGRLR
jgi:hypothetical protein